jgi:hypothetical protein
MPFLTELWSFLWKRQGFDAATEKADLFTKFLTLFVKKHQKTACPTGTLQKSCTLSVKGKNKLK